MQYTDMQQELQTIIPQQQSEVGSTTIATITYQERDPAPPLPHTPLTPQPVPEAPKPQPMPLLRMIMPLVMLVAIVAMVGLIVLSGATLHPFMLMMPIMMGMGALMMFTPPQGEDTNETRRTYLRHLAALREQALRNAKQQRQHTLHYHPAPEDLIAHIGTRRMWERSAEDNDALAIRIGTGKTPLVTPCELADPGAPEDLDPVCAVAVRQVIKGISTVDAMPIVVQLAAFRVLALRGPLAAEVANAVLAQLVSHHGPEAVGIHAVGVRLQWGKWLPHTKDYTHAAYQILVLDEGVDVDQQLLHQHWSCIITIGEHQDSQLLSWAEEEGFILQCEGTQLQAVTESGLELLGVPDLLSDAAAQQLARQLHGYTRPQQSLGGSSDIRRLLGVNTIEPQQISQQWVPRGVRRLQVPIGVDARGNPQLLDIKESAHGGYGPHGLCVGATGSGKSELLRTLVLAMAATHSPEDLNLVLVDFKGGATFLGLEQLPHTSAVITNLADEAVLVERMHDALSGEMHRRQELLRQAGNCANVGEYLDKRQQQPDLPPLPALFIVVDEFSELLGQHPDFADLFVAIGRLGRSLHMHLLLASQRLEEGRLRGLDSHLSYRIGLKTFSAAESRQVLGIPDAYELPNQPGTGYLKTGAEPPTRFRASYVSGPLMVPQHQLHAVPKVVPFHSWADIQNTEDDPAHTQIADPQGATVIGSFVEAIVAAAQVHKMQAHQIWLPPLPAQLELAGVVESHGFLAAAIGIIDRPYVQRQDALVLEFSGQHGHLAICGGPQTGKTTALRSLVLSLAATHSTAQLRFYILDLSGTGLGALDRLGHVAGVAHRNDAERVHRVIDEVLSFVHKPAEHLHTFLIVDGWHSLAQDFEERMDDLITIASDGLAAKVHLIVSTPRWTTLRPVIRDVISNRIELKLGEALDSLIDRKAQAALPAAPGRGLIANAEQILIALSSAQDVAHVAQVTSNQEPVPALQMLPEQIFVSELPAPETPGLLLGIGGPAMSTQTFHPEQAGHLLCLGGQASGKSTLVHTLLQQIVSLGPEQARIVLIDHRRSHLGVVPDAMSAAYSATSQQTQNTINDVLATMQKRLPPADITPEALKARNWWQGPEIYLVIDDLELLADGALHGLVELLPHARDIGLHLIVSRKLGGATRALYQPFMSALKDLSPSVLILSGEKDDGPIFGMRPSNQVPGRASYIVRGTQVGTIQIAIAPTQGEEDAASSGS